jgi:parallel beta-helix repeat protein
VIFTSAAGVTLSGIRVTGGVDHGVRLLGAQSVVENVEAFANGVGGKVNGTGSRVTDVYSHHNTRYGIAAQDGTGIVIANVRVEYNRSNGTCDGASGGSKFVETTDMVIRDSQFDHNNCAGIWFDINNVRPLAEGNRVVATTGEGLVCEISYECRFLRNTVLDSTCGGIVNRGSPDTEIAHNTVRGNSRNCGQGDLVLYGAFRTDFPHPLGPHVTRRNHVHDNIIQVNAKVGVVLGDTGDPDPSALFDAATNRFRSNHYDARSCSTGGWFRWNGSRTWSQWRAIPQDNDPAASCV